MSKPFQFKQFTVQQDKCAMKIGTDGVLLGAWTSIPKTTYSILDIGAGTGVIALMLAQRSGAEIIDAIEIEEDAYEQCVENFETSDWNDRLFCYHASLDEFAEEIEDKYDLIVSNPPFYEDAFPSANDRRDQARFTKALPFQELLKHTSQLLSENGVFCTIIPSQHYDTFLAFAKAEKLNLKRVTFVKGNENSPIKRCLLQFGFTSVETIEKDKLIIETERHHYTEAYKNLVKDFYLKL
ncbi:tRNA1(Val) (adenine(37)-N6)-methyltransferase [Mesonia sp. K7]|uniref:tRNA1(Val) (adenine(37)-N6)-methyltransferase n=1 Tax=Mesonia sp. K7 TaxID=2218606 RepID=UPI000DA8D482|nr:methyltransferase [Mesonia sp. K7]PZD77715.1 tRNA (adenine-N(6)-)-methyltransferase [Mesonia sp. K7]